MRNPLRHAVVQSLQSLVIEQIDQGGRHTTIRLRGGETILVHGGGRVKRIFERSLRSQVRKLTETAVVG
jgi:hypothetical protein